MRGRLSKPVLSVSSKAHQEEAAWDLLTAVREMFPGRFAELTALWADLSDDLGEVGFGDLYCSLADSVDQWTSRNRISCPAVDEVATSMAAGFRPAEVLAGTEGLPPIRANPFGETLEEFLDRARQHYNKVRRSFEARGFKRQVKREYDHFRYLAAHLIGKYSWAEIARGDAPFELPRKSSKTIAGEARKAAQLVGLCLPNKPGPRPGSRAPRRRRRRR